MDRQLMLAKLKGHGLRVTSPRVTLLDVLCGMTQPATIEQLFARTEKAGQATCDLVTIYRTMAAFEKAGVVYRSGFSERGAVLYSTHVGGSRRYPLVQRGTSVVEELDGESSAELKATIEKIRQRLHARGYTGLEHIVEFFALPPLSASNQPAE